MIACSKYTYRFQGVGKQNSVIYVLLFNDHRDLDLEVQGDQALKLPRDVLVARASNNIAIPALL